MDVEAFPPGERERERADCQLKRDRGGRDRTRILSVSHRRPIYRKRRRDRKKEREGRKRKEQTVCGRELRRAPLWGTSFERERVVRGRCTVRIRTRQSQQQQKQEEEVKRGSSEKAKRETERKEFKREGAPRDGAREANKLCLTRGTTS